MGYVGKSGHISISEYGGRQGPAEIFDENGKSLLKGEIYSDEVSLVTKGDFTPPPRGMMARIEIEDQQWTIRMRNVQHPIPDRLIAVPTIAGVEPLLIAILRQQHKQMVVFDEADLVGQENEHIVVTSNASGMTVVRLEKHG